MKKIILALITLFVIFFVISHSYLIVGTSIILLLILFVGGCIYMLSD